MPLSPTTVIAIAVGLFLAIVILISILHSILFLFRKAVVR